MKKFVVKMIGMLGCVVTSFLIINFLYYKVDNISGLIATEVYDAINIAERGDDYSAVVLGDSVARQFFHPDYQGENQDICYLATNQAITPAGNYVLMEEFLKNNPQTEKVYYVARPESLCTELNFRYSYSYFVTPFYNERFKMYLENETIDGVEKTFGRLWTGNEYAKWMLAKYPKMLEIYSDACRFFNNLRIYLGRSASPDVAMTYLGKMQKKCEENDIEFCVLSAPLPEGYEFDFQKLEQQMEMNGLRLEYDKFLKSIHYIDAVEFVDGIHLNKNYVQVNRGQVIMEIITEEGES